MPPRTADDADNSPWKTCAEHVVYTNQWMRVTEYDVIRPDGSLGIYGVADPGDNATIAATDELGRIMLIRDFVYPAQQWKWMLPGGSVELGEAPLVAAQRELLEEGGLLAEDWRLLGTFLLSAGISPQLSYCYSAAKITVTQAAPEATELITRKWAFLREAEEMIRSGEIQHSTAALAIMALLLQNR